MSDPFAPTCADCGAVLYLGNCRECNALDDADLEEELEEELEAGIELTEAGAHVGPGTPTPDVEEALVTALLFERPLRWAIGDLALAIRARGGEAALFDAAPEDPKRQRAMFRCLRVAERFNEDWRMSYPELDFGHFRRVVGYDDGAASEALQAARDNDWTPAQLGKLLAGVEPDEPAVGLMLEALARALGDGTVGLRFTGGGWRLVVKYGELVHEGPEQPTHTAAIRAAYRQWKNTARIKLDQAAA